MHLNLFKNENNKIFFLCILVVTILVLFPFLQTGFTTNDDGSNQILAFNNEYWKSIALDQGRVQFLLFHHWIIQLSALIHNLVLIKVMTISLVVLNILYFSHFVAKYSGDKYLGFLFSIFFLTFLQDSWEHFLITSSPLIYTTAFLILIISLDLFIKYKESGNHVFLYFSGFIYIFAMQISEMYFLLFILFPLVNLKYTRNIKQNIKDIMIPFIFYASYICVYLVFRYYIATGSGYDGNQVTGDFSLVNFFKTLRQYSLSPIPGYLFLHNNFAMIRDINVYLNFENLLVLSNSFGRNYFLGVQFICENFYKLEVDWIVKYLIFAFLFASYIDKIIVKNKNILSILSIILIFLPNLPHALTSKYQNWVVISGSTGYVGTYISFFGISLLSILLFSSLISYFRKPYIKNLVVSVILIIFFPLSMFTSITNFATLESKIMTNKKWELIEKFTTSKTFHNINENSIIYAPSLFEGNRGIISQHEDTYWSDYIQQVSGKKLTIVKNLDSVNLKNNKNIYYLNYTQNMYQEDAFIVFAKIHEIKNNSSDVFVNEFYTYDFSFFPYSKKLKSKLSFDTNSYDSVLTFKKSNLVDASAYAESTIVSANGSFEFEIDNKDKVNSGIEYLFKSQNKILLNSVYVEGYLYDKSPKVDKKLFLNSKLSNDFYPLESNENNQWNWSKRNSFIEIENSSKDNIEAKVIFSLSTNQNKYSKIRIKFNNKVLDEIRVNDKPYLFEKKIRLNSGSNKIEFEVIKSERIMSNSDTRELYFTISNYSITDTKDRSEPFININKPEFKDGFFGWESDGSNRWIWSDKNSLIEIFNNSNNELSLQLEIKIATQTKKYSKIQISLNEKIIDEIKVNDQPYLYIKKIDFVKNNNKITFKVIEGDKVKTDPRELYFMISEFHLKQIEL